VGPDQRRGGGTEASIKRREGEERKKGTGMRRRERGGGRGEKRFAIPGSVLGRSSLNSGKDWNL